jgi:hypothetical protein
MRISSGHFVLQLTISAAQQDGFDRHLLDLDPSQYPRAAMVSKHYLLFGTLKCLIPSIKDRLAMLHLLYTQHVMHKDINPSPISTPHKPIQQPDPALDNTSHSHPSNDMHAHLLPPSFCRVHSFPSYMAPNRPRIHDSVSVYTC